MARNRRQQAPDEDSITIRSTVKTAKVDQDGEWTLTLSIPSCDGAKVAALSLQSGTVFDTKFTENAEQIPDGSGPDEQPIP